MGHRAENLIDRLVRGEGSALLELRGGAHERRVPKCNRTQSSNSLTNYPTPCSSQTGGKRANENVERRRE
jgi:hypothetical protein